MKMVRTRSLVPVAIVLVLVLAGMTSRATAAPTRIIALGDSSVSAKGDVESDWLERIAKRLNAEGSEAEVVNAAHPGDTTATAIQRLHRDVIDREPDLVIIQYGLDDSMVDVAAGRAEPRVPLDQFTRNLREIVTILHAEGIACLLLTPSPVVWSDALRAQYDSAPYDTADRWGFNVLLPQYARAVWKVASSTGAAYVDINTLLDLWDRRPNLSLDALMLDGMHLNDDGHAFIARHVWPRVWRMQTSGELPRPPRPPHDHGEPLILVNAGQPRDVEGEWRAGDGFIEGTGAPLYARRTIERGAFLLTARLRMLDQQGSAASFFLEDDVFGFDGAKDTMFVSGPGFGGLRLLAPPTDIFNRGDWIDFEVERFRGELRFRINGRTVHAQPAGRVAYERVGFGPMRSTMQVSDLRLYTARSNEAPRRGWTIPLVDLAGETDRQVVVDREADQYLGHPTTVLLEDGRTIIAVFPKGHGGGAIVMKRSDDGGQTWSDRLPVPADWETSREVPTIHRTVDPKTGRRRLLMFSGLDPIRMTVSEDDGVTWSSLAPIGDFGGIVAMASVERLTNGDYIALFHDDGRFIDGSGVAAETMTLYQTFSADGGLTWSRPQVIHEDDAVHLCEPGIVRSPDGRQLVILLRENRRRRNTHLMVSDDEGATWSRPMELPGAITGDRHTARYAPDGRLFISFRDTALSSPTQGDWVGWVGTFDDLMRRREGQYRVRLMDNHHEWDCAYPGVECLPDGTFVVTTYGHWTPGEPPYIASVRFTLAELDEKARAIAEE